MPDLFVATKHLQTQNKEESAAPEILKTAHRTKNHSHVFSSFCENPDEVSFAEQEENEDVLLFLRRHFITNVPWITTAIFVFLLPLAIMLFSNIFTIALPIFPGHTSIFLFLFYYLLVFSYVIASFFTWLFNISLITNKRVIDIDFSNLVYKNVAATKLDLVQDASFSQIGVIRSVFDYGDVLIQTAGSLDNFDLLAVPHPEKVIQVTENLIGKEKNVF